MYAIKIEDRKPPTNGVRWLSSLSIRCVCCAYSEGVVYYCAQWCAFQALYVAKNDSGRGFKGLTGDISMQF